MEKKSMLSSASRAPMKRGKYMCYVIMLMAKKAAIVKLVEGGRSFSEFTDEYSELELCAGLTDEEIIRQVLVESESDDDDDSPAAAQSTQAELMRAVATLSSAYGGTTTLGEIQADLLARERSMVQKSIHHFFRPLTQ